MGAFPHGDAHRAAVLLLVLGAAACDPAGPKRTADSSCGAPGILHDEDIDDAVWRPVDGPHYLARTLSVTGTLTIDAGSLVCGAPGAELRLASDGVLEARGSVDEPIVFTAADSTRPWEGITSEENSQRVALTLVNARIEHAHVGVLVAFDSRLTIDGAVIRKIQGPAVDLGANSDGALAHVVVEDACLDSRVRPGQPGCEAAVVQRSTTTLSLLDVHIRRSGGDGLAAFLARSLRLRDVRIEESAGFGLYISPYKDRSADLTDAASVRITGGGSYPAAMPGKFAHAFFRAIPPDSLLGNAVDTLIVYNDIPGGRVTASLPWELHAFDTGGNSIDSLTIEPGGHLRIAHPPDNDQLLVSFVGSLIAQGTPAAPITITSATRRRVVLGGTSGDTTRIGHAHLENLWITVSDPHVLQLEDALVTGGHIRLDAPGSTIRRSTILAAGDLVYDATTGDLVPSGGAVTIAGAGTVLEDTRIIDATNHGLLVVAPDVRVDRCEITGAAADGVQVNEPAVGFRILQSNLFGNAGLGLGNGTDSAADARSNWWGDPAGPHGPDGDGIGGPVDFEPWLTAPAGPAGG